MATENFKLQAKIASLRADAYAKLAEAEQLEKTSCGDMLAPLAPPVVAPASAGPGEPTAIVISIPQGVKLASLTALNKVSAELVALGGEDNLKSASEIDKIAESIEKMAKTIESDSDEGYMRNHFKSGVLQNDSDEGFMKEFNTDLSDETKNGLPAKGNTPVPYEKI